MEVSGAGTVSLLYSAAHWLFLIKLAEEEKKHDVVVELFRLALTLKAEVRVYSWGHSLKQRLAY